MGPHEVAYFVGKGERNGVVELSCLHGSERYAVCFDARQAAVAGLKAVETPSTSCESCHALSELFPIAGARAAKTAKKKTIATILATTQGKNSNFKLA